MSPRQWFSLLAFYIAYLFFGAIVFYTIEQELETQRRYDAVVARIEINELLAAHTAVNDTQLQNEIFNKVTTYCEKPVTNYTADPYPEPYVWTFYHAFFFSFTVCSTVGYGNISPNNTFGRIFMMFYALIGIPVNGIMFAYLGEFFGTTFVKLYRRYKMYKLSQNRNYVPRKFGLIVQIALYLMPGVLIFIFLPACLFTIFEDWPYSISVYYAFVTLTTIGFGDYAASFQPNQPHDFGIYFIFYEIFIIFWFIFGLGYLVMIMGFIARGMRSKKITHLEHKLAANIKATQSKIWSGVTKDVGYLRRILNEIYLLKFKPVYRETGDKQTFNSLPRSESCPDLNLYRTSTPPSLRKRAHSECIGGAVSLARLERIDGQITRAASDSDLSRIDKKLTFEGVNAVVQPGELLARVVTALGNMRPADDNDGQSVLEFASNTGGYHGFSDSQILASERTWSGWSLPSSEDKPYLTAPAFDNRSKRASSEVKISSNSMQNINDYTWSGPASDSQIQKLQREIQMRQRRNGDIITKTGGGGGIVSFPKRKEDLYRASFGLGHSHITDLRNGDTQPSSLPTQFAPNIPNSEIQPTSAINRSIFSRLNPFRRVQNNSAPTSVSSAPEKRHSMACFDPEAQRYLDATTRGRITSRMSLAQPSMTHGRSSVFSLTAQDEVDHDLLERTTIGDLIRALEVVHTQEVTSASQTSLAPRRKLGTASLTPPKVPSLMTLFPHNMTQTTPPFNDGGRRHSVHPALFSAGTSNASQQIRRTGAIQPPPYSSLPGATDSPMPMRRRFSVRPSSLAIPPGQAPPVASSILQKRLTNRVRSSSRTTTTGFRPSQLATIQGDMAAEERTRHGSLSNLYERRVDQIERKRTDSS